MTSAIGIGVERRPGSPAPCSRSGSGSSNSSASLSPHPRPPGAGTTTSYGRGQDLFEVCVSLGEWGAAWLEIAHVKPIPGAVSSAG